MSYQNTFTLEVEPYRNLAAFYPNASIPVDGTLLIAGTWHVIAPTTRPAYDSYTQGLRELAPVNYVQVWEVYPLAQQEVDDHLSSAKANKYDEIWREYDRLVAEVEDSATTSKEPRKGGSLKAASDKRLTKKSKGGNLNPNELDAESWYEGFLDWCGMNHDAADLAGDSVETMTDPVTVTAYDAVNDPAWVPFT